MIQKLVRLGPRKPSSNVSVYALAYLCPACATLYMNAEYTTANPILTANTPMINATIAPHPLPVSCHQSTPAR
jgi:hypothetical protein